MTAKESSRYEWIDVARGLSIILVVLHHSLPRYGGEMFKPLLSAYAVSDLFLSLRMPLFFTISGMLAASIVRLNFKELLQKRIINLIYLYLLWATFKIVVTSLDVVPHDPAGPIGRILSLLWAPPATLWYIYALAIFVFGTWLLAKINIYALLAASVVVYLLFYGSEISFDQPFHLRLIRMYPWFLMGLVLRHQILQVADRARPWHAVLFLVWLGLALLTVNMFGAHPPSFVMLGLSFAGVVGGTALAIAFSATFAGPALRKIGSNTLPIYVAHFLAVWPATQLIMKFGLGPWALVPTIMLGVTLPLLGKSVTDRLGLLWLFRAPDALQKLPERLKFGRKPALVELDGKVEP